MTDTQDHFGGKIDRAKRGQSPYVRDDHAHEGVPGGSRVHAGSVDDRGHPIAVPDLLAFVRNDILPRLARPNSSALVTSSTVRSEEVAEGDRQAVLLCDVLLHAGRDAAIAQADQLIADGMSHERFFLDVLAPASAHLRLMWEDDLCGYAEAILASQDMQAVLRHAAPAFRAVSGGAHLRDRPAPLAGARAIMLTTARDGTAGEIGTAMFGLMMMSEFFRRDGWQPWLEDDVNSMASRTAAAAQWFDVVEVLVAGGASLDRVANGIRDLRRASANRSLGIIVCGQAFIEHPANVRLVGADVLALNPLSSLEQATRLCVQTGSSARLGCS